MVKISPIVERLTSLKNEQVYSAFIGDYKGFKKAAKEYAKLAVTNFDEARKAKAMEVKVPLFSSYGLKMTKVWFLNKFRIKTPEEKAFKKLAKEYKMKKDFEKIVKK